MPTLSVIAIRIALLNLLLGWTVGAALLVHKSGAFTFDDYLALREAHFHLLFFGWTVQLGIGVAFWILPKFVGENLQFYGAKRLAESSILALNLGVLGAIGSKTLAWTFYTASALLFVGHIWPRVKPFSGAKKSESL
jgi:hypothetical protein